MNKFMRSENHPYKMGIDVGSTTIKIVLLNDQDKIAYKSYQRHKTDIHKILGIELGKINLKFPSVNYKINITGSAGMGISERTGIPFIQEVIASVNVINRLYPDTRTLIDLGGEDAKMVFFESGKNPDIRMNGSCAGGTGAFIDQMADLLNISIEDLGKEAVRYTEIYPIASRCGVFAKTDVQNLISRNIPISDLSKSILHTVAVQSITSLARGREIKPNILCIGGPLTFIPELRKSFIDLLCMNDEDFILPENSEFFPALGSALHINATDRQHIWKLEDIEKKLSENDIRPSTNSLGPLFESKEEYVQWKKGKNTKKLKTRELKENETVDCFLGIDSGSTTTKIVVIDKELNILYKYYAGNKGNSLGKTMEGLEKFFQETKQKKVQVRFIASAATGYGEDLVKSAFNLDYGIVETMAHLSGAQYVDKNVSFILDIGGQDIKSIFVSKGVISNIELNEACSSGCGSFLQNFASTMNMDLKSFSNEACIASNPCDLGSRCTVFMNSKVKQSLRENFRLGDISAGLAYSVIKNCLYKVLKISNLKTLGDNIVVQGGTFKNDAVYRALELSSGKNISSTDIPELMGALGAAIYSHKMWEKGEISTSSFLGEESIPDLASIERKELKCKGCTNTCSIIKFIFANHNICYAGNKCEKYFYNKNSVHLEDRYNAFDEKNKILFERIKQNSSQENGLTIGIPRVLNMYENFPFWNILFQECGFNVELSPESTSKLYEKGVSSVMSENICFPAKLVHGHILSLINKKVDRIFYPIVPKEEKELKNSSNSYNCPVVSGYPEVVQSSLDPWSQYGVPFDKPVINFTDDKSLAKSCYKYFSSLGISLHRFKVAFARALHEKTAFQSKLIEKQKRIFLEALKRNEWSFIVTGRPYHADPLINQKIGQILVDLGINVFTDDVFRKDEDKGFSNLNVVSQWSYPNRVIQTAMRVAKLPDNVQMIQLNSFGCGPDSFFLDETDDILKCANKSHTILRIDEISSPGSIRLRLRSMIESLKSTSLHKGERQYKKYKGYETTYTLNDKKKTILVPWFSNFISPFVPAFGKLMGYRIANLMQSSSQSVESGLKYGHNEVCYPSTLILGDIINTLKSGKYDPDETVIGITQTGGQCRATNYISQIKNGLKNAGYNNIPVLALTKGKTFQNEQEAFTVNIKKIADIALHIILYGDSLQQMFSSISIREKKKGEAKKTFDFYVEQGIKAVENNDCKQLLKNLKQAVCDFNDIEVSGEEFVKVGLIGEIFVKYNDFAQANITSWLQSQRVEVQTPPFLDFVMQYFINSQVNENNGLDKKSIQKYWMRKYAWNYINRRNDKVKKIMKDFKYYIPYESIYLKAQYASEIVDLANQFGEGWCIPAEIAEFSQQGINRIVCIQPFGCIANHIVAKGIEKRLKKFYPDLSLLFLDIDGGIAEVNLQNRLHFMINN